ncbi:primosome assembly protein PriA [Oleiphilus sp. HI0072]|nr:primosome assembly protein PriA [Oleiphilus sp. HI0072]
MNLDFPLQIRGLGEHGEFSGYASVFDVVDGHGTALTHGAFMRTLKEWKAKKRLPAMLWQHKTDEPIGVYTAMREDSKGLKVEGRLLIENDPLAKRAYAHLKAGSINGLSIGFHSSAKSESYDESTGATLLHDVDLIEVSLVTFPSNQNATITNVRNLLHAGQIPAPRYVEEILRDAGFSRRQAKTIISDGLKALSLRDAEEESLNELNHLISNWSIKHA